MKVVEEVSIYLVIVPVRVASVTRHLFLDTLHLILAPTPILVHNFIPHLPLLALITNVVLSLLSSLLILILILLLLLALLLPYSFISNFLLRRCLSTGPTLILIFILPHFLALFLIRPGGAVLNTSTTPLKGAKKIFLRWDQPSSAGWQLHN
ncbi:hypothetical protein BJ165DRAFT_1426469 [Panaeolus papilionaceus]|nr:hypothetical protein BJ165DRAFT_1426469 [Panaeolus papilionaceus]